MNDHDDRLVDVALQELHGSRPPDLSARVLLALQEGGAGSLPRLVPRPSRGWPFAALWIAALLFGAGAAVAVRAFGGPSPLPNEVAALVVQAIAGEVEGRAPGGARSFVATPDAAPVRFVAARGHRLWSANASSFQLAPFGHLVVAAQTELEVRAMEWSVRSGVVAASSLTLAVVAGVVTWHTLTDSGTAAAGETVRLQAEDGSSSLAIENARLRQRLGELEREMELRAHDAARAPVEPPPPPPPVAAVTAEAPSAPATPAAGAVAFTDPQFAAALAKIDWGKLGADTNELAPLLVDLAEQMAAEGAELPMALAIKVQEANQRLVAQVPAILETGLPGFGPNGSYTHPLVTANTLASALQAAGQPLSADQRAKIEGLARTFSAESRAIADGTRELELEGLLAEVEMKDRFYREVGGVLAPQQHGTIWRTGSQTYEGTNLFDTGVMMRVHAQPVPAKDPADFARVVSGRLTERLGLDDATAAQVRAVLAQSAGASELWRDRASPIETSAVHFLKSGRTQTALRHQLEWTRQILRQVPLSAEQRKKLASMGQVLVPLPR
jgi:hypothetical protein